MARRTVSNIPHRKALLKCQIRLAAAKAGVRVQVIAGPESPTFAGVRIWPDGDDEQRVVALKGGEFASTSFALGSDEDFWVEISYGPGKKNSVQIKYERKRPFGFRAAKVSNPSKVNLIGSVPRIR